MLGHRFWRSHFAGDPAVVGRSLQLGTERRTIVGVLPPEADRFPAGGADVWAPLTFPPASFLNQRGSIALSAIGRLRADTTIAAAQDDISTIGARLATAYPDTNRVRKVMLDGLQDAMVGHRRLPGSAARHGAVAARRHRRGARHVHPVTAGAWGDGAGLTLLLAIVGLHGVVSYAVAQRTREIGVRLALGLRPTAVVRLVLGDTLRTIALGAVPGVLASIYAGRWLSSVVAVHANLPSTLGVVVAIFVAAALAAAAGPAWRASRVDPIVALRTG
jgi:FtsX-like permease family